MNSFKSVAKRVAAGERATTVYAQFRVAVDEACTNILTEPVEENNLSTNELIKVHFDEALLRKLDAQSDGNLEGKIEKQHFVDALVSIVEKQDDPEKTAMLLRQIINLVARVLERRASQEKKLHAAELAELRESHARELSSKEIVPTRAVPVEHTQYVDRIVEKPVDRIVDRMVEKIVTVQVDKPYEVEKTVEVYKLQKAASVFQLLVVALMFLVAGCLAGSYLAKPENWPENALEALCPTQPIIPCPKTGRIWRK